MASKKVANKELSVVTLSSGKVYLGVVSKAGITDAYELKGIAVPNDHVFRAYVKARVMNQLSPIDFSPVSDYTSRPLSPEEAACYANVSGLFKLAQGQAVAFNEVACFEALFGKK